MSKPKPTTKRKTHTKETRMKVFNEYVRTGSLTAAAKKYNVNYPTVQYWHRTKGWKQTSEAIGTIVPYQNNDPVIVPITLSPHSFRVIHHKATIENQSVQKWIEDYLNQMSS